MLAFGRYYDTTNYMSRIPEKFHDVSVFEAIVVIKRGFLAPMVRPFLFLLTPHMQESIGITPQYPGDVGSALS